jgi:signal transduction histidine kinase
MLRPTSYGGVGRPETRREIRISGDRPVSMTASVVYEGEREVATVGILTDLRDRIRMEQRLLDAQQKLQLSEKQALVAELAGAAAHELNQPLTSIMGYAQLIQRQSEKQAAHLRAVGVILSEAERMAGIVKKIGKITKYETPTTSAPHACSISTARGLRTSGTRSADERGHALAQEVSEAVTTAESGLEQRASRISSIRCRPRQGVEPMTPPCRRWKPSSPPCALAASSPQPPSRRRRSTRDLLAAARPSCASACRSAQPRAGALRARSAQRILEDPSRSPRPR